MEVSAERLARAAQYVRSLERKLAPRIKQVEEGPFVTSVLEGTFPLDGIRFVHLNHYHQIMNDTRNLNIFASRARDEDDMLTFHLMAAEEKNQLASFYLLTDALGIKRNQFAGSEPYGGCLLRTNYSSRLAWQGTLGEMALGMILSSSVWAAGARQEAIGLREHYGLGKTVPGTDKKDTDILDMSGGPTRDFEAAATKLIARDLTDEKAKEKMVRQGMWAAEYEVMVWNHYYEEGLGRCKSVKVRRRV
jgi:hypothetical protein